MLQLKTLPVVGALAFARALEAQVPAGGALLVSAGVPSLRYLDAEGVEVEEFFASTEDALDRGQTLGLVIWWIRKAEIVLGQLAYVN